jgi:hypothetical protein
VVSFITRFGKGAALGMISVATSHWTGTKLGQPFDGERFQNEMWFGAGIGLAVDLAAQGGSLGGRILVGASQQRIAAMATRMEQLRRQLPNAPVSELFGKMARKAAEYERLAGQTANQRLFEALGSFATQVEESALFSSVDDIARRLSTYIGLDSGSE